MRFHSILNITWVKISFINFLKREFLLFPWSQDHSNWNSKFRTRLWQLFYNLFWNYLVNTIFSFNSLLNSKTKVQSVTFKIFKAFLNTVHISEKFLEGVTSFVASHWLSLCALFITFSPSTFPPTSPQNKKQSWPERSLMML